MRLVRAIATLFFLVTILIGSFTEPARAVQSCQVFCANRFDSCNTKVEIVYQACITSCDSFLPFGSPCHIQCSLNQQVGLAQCASDYNACLSSGICPK